MRSVKLTTVLFVLAVHGLHAKGAVLNGAQNEISRNNVNNNEQRKDSLTFSRTFVDQDVVHGMSQTISKHTDKQSTEAIKQSSNVKASSLNQTESLQHDHVVKLARTYLEEIFVQLSPNKTCFICKVVIATVQGVVKLNEDRVARLADSICKVLHIEDYDICDGIIKLFKRMTLTVLEDLVLNPEEFCGAVLYPNCGNFYDPYQMWNITIPPRANSSRHGGSSQRDKGSTGPTLRVLQISDIHVDIRYITGASLDCDRPMCCRNTSGPVKKHGLKSGKWGSYGLCDVPPRTVEHMFKFLSENDKFDYILWTGDLPSHADWNQTRENQLYLVKYLTDLFVKYFPDTPIFSAVGNHEGLPVNAFAPPYITGEGSVEWLYDSLQESWGHWLPIGTSGTIKLGAYYTTLVKPGFRIVSLNMNYCNTQNWWMFLNTTDPAQELQWLVGVLYRAEVAGEKVQIIGHIPPGAGDCLKAWSWNYYNLVNRFADTICGQFFGHYHSDFVQLFYDEETLQKPVSVAYVSPSVTTYPRMNPAYRVYTMDGFYNGSSWGVLDHTTYILNLTKANAAQEIPTWEEEYSAKKAYNLTGLTPTDWDQFSRRMLHDTKLAQLFYKYYHKSPAPSQFPHCDDKCVRNYVCMLRTGRPQDPELCKDITDWDQFVAFRKAERYC